MFVFHKKVDAHCILKDVRQQEILVLTASSREKYGNGQGAEISTLDSEAHVGCDGIDTIGK